MSISPTEQVHVDNCEAYMKLWALQDQTLGILSQAAQLGPTFLGEQSVAEWRKTLDTVSKVARAMSDQLVKDIVNRPRRSIAAVPLTRLLPGETLAREYYGRLGGGSEGAIWEAMNRIRAAVTEDRDFLTRVHRSDKHGAVGIEDCEKCFPMTTRLSATTNHYVLGTSHPNDLACRICVAEERREVHALACMCADCILPKPPGGMVARMTVRQRRIGGPQ